MKWSQQENAGRQGVMFDLMLGEVVEPLERVAPSERTQAEAEAEYRSCRLTAAERAALEVQR